MNKFAERLKELRQEKGLSKKALAKELDFTQPAIAKWESGKRQPSLEVICKLTEFFEVSSDYLIGLID